MTGDDDAELVAVNFAFGGGHAFDLTALLAHSGDFALLDDVHTHVRTGAGIAPSDRIMTRGAATGLPERTEHGIARAFEFDDRAKFLDPGGADELGLDALQVVGVCGALVAADFVFGLGQHHHAAGART